MKEKIYMGVSQDTFPELNKESGLLIVTGMKLLHMYRLLNGTLKLVESISQPEVDTDRQKGRFEHRADGELMSSTEVMNQRKKEDQNRFLGDISDVTKKIRFKYDKVFLFAPLRFSAAVQRALPEKMQAKIIQTFAGNYIKNHENDLLEMIKERRIQIKKQNTPAPHRKEVVKLLKPKPKK